MWFPWPRPRWPVAARPILRAVLVIGLATVLTGLPGGLSHEVPVEPTVEETPACEPRFEYDMRCWWFDSLLDLAERADRALGAEPEWREVSHEWGHDLHRIARAVMIQFVDLGMVRPERSSVLATGTSPSARWPESISWENYAGDASRVIGRYYTVEKRVSLNRRYLDDAGWRNRSYLAPLVHELIHAQGYTDEMVTESLTLVTLASLGNLNSPGFRRTALEQLRNDALWSAYNIATRHGNMLPTLWEYDCQNYRYGYECPPVEPPNERMLAQLNDVRRLLLTDAELRYSDARIRWWERHDIETLLSLYVSKPLAFALQAGCSEPALMPDNENWKRVVEGESFKQAVLADDLAYLLDEIGWRCPSFWTGRPESAVGIEGSAEAR
jgi:hypothetical protein